MKEGYRRYRERVVRPHYGEPLRLRCRYHLHSRYQLVRDFESLVRGRHMGRKIWMRAGGGGHGGKKKEQGQF